MAFAIANLEEDLRLSALSVAAGGVSWTIVAYQRYAINKRTGPPLFVWPKWTIWRTPSACQRAPSASASGRARERAAYALHQLRSGNEEWLPSRPQWPGPRGLRSRRALKALG